MYKGTVSHFQKIYSMVQNNCLVISTLVIYYKKWCPYKPAQHINKLVRQKHLCTI